MPFVERNILKAHMGSGTLEHDAGIISQAKEGSSREGKKDYLHFLYIARGSLSEARPRAVFDRSVVRGRWSVVSTPS